MLRLLNFENQLVPSVNKMRTREYRVATEPAFDIFETPESYIIEADVPGFVEDELDISITDSVLTVRGRRQDEAHSERTCLHRERRSGPFERRFRLGNAVDPSTIKATAVHGVLSVEVAKAASRTPQKVPIAFH